jgi:sugar phosphate isomerase/epimerase
MTGMRMVLTVALVVACAGAIVYANCGSCEGDKASCTVEEEGCGAEQAACGAQAKAGCCPKPNAGCCGKWKLSVQAYSFKMFTFYEAIDKAEAMGLKYIEAYSKQKLSPDQPDVVFNHESPKKVRRQVKKKLADAGVTLINYGVVKLTGVEEEDRKIFDFAKDMGIQTIVSEPEAKTEVFDAIEKLCKEYKIQVALHNHPAPSKYYNPEAVLAVLKGRSKWIGACADNGHWMRSGIDPIEALKKLEGKILSLHFKDLNAFGERKAHDVPWGTGKGNVKAVLTELKRQGFEGVFSIEYEHNWENSVPEITRSVAYFNKTAAAL